MHWFEMMKTRADYERLLEIVRSVLSEWDPYSLIAEGAPPDELHGEASSIAAQVKTISTPADLTRVISDVFSKNFEPEYFTLESCVSVGTNLYARLREENMLEIDLS